MFKTVFLALLLFSFSLQSKTIKYTQRSTTEISAAEAETKRLYVKKSKKWLPSDKKDDDFRFLFPETAQEIIIEGQRYTSILDFLERTKAFDNKDKDLEESLKKAFDSLLFDENDLNERGKKIEALLKKDKVVISFPYERGQSEQDRDKRAKLGIVWNEGHTSFKGNDLVGRALQKSIKRKKRKRDSPEEESDPKRLRGGTAGDEEKEEESADKKRAPKRKSNPDPDGERPLPSPPERRERAKKVRKVERKKSENFHTDDLLIKLFDDSINGDQLVEYMGKLRQEAPEKLAEMYQSTNSDDQKLNPLMVGIYFAKFKGDDVGPGKDRQEKSLKFLQEALNQSKQGVNIGLSHQDSLGNTPLLTSLMLENRSLAQSGGYRTGITRALSQLTPDEAIAKKNRFNSDIFTHALRNNNMQMAQLALQKIPDRLNCKSPQSGQCRNSESKSTEILLAAKNNNLPIFKAMIEGMKRSGMTDEDIKVHLNLENNWGSTPLTWAARNKNTEMFKYLKSVGAIENQKTKDTISSLECRPKKTPKVQAFLDAINGIVNPNKEDPGKGAEEEKEPEEYHKKLGFFQINQSAKVIVKNGIFQKGCKYSESLSDHAPVISQDSKIGTWNIGMRIDDNDHEKPTGEKYKTHKMQLDEVDALGGDKKETDEKYKQRLTKISGEIETMMNEQGLNLFVLQETPYPKQKGKDEEEEMWKHFREELDAKGLELVSSSGRDNQALVRKKGESSSHKSEDLPESVGLGKGAKSHRFGLSCDGNKDCVVNLHARPFADNSKGFCDEMSKIRDHAKGSVKAKSLRFVGDFNQSAKELKQRCPNLGFKVKVETFKGEGMSCADNKGGHNSENIDMFLKVSL